MRVLVTGGREYQNQALVWKTLDGLGVTEILHGGARGADHLAGEWAKARGVDATQYLPDWRSFGPAAGPMRNERMIQEGRPDLVVAFPGGDGTADCLRRAHAAGIAVRLVEDA